jgi:CRISPR-associated protein Cas1
MHAPVLDDILTDASLLAGWARVRENRGGPGVDGQTIEQFGRRLMGNIRLLRNEVNYETYRPLPLLRVYIPKKSGGERPLSIPAVRDRVLQSATAIVLTPVFEAEFEEVSFAYRRGRSVDQAAARVAALRDQGYRWVVDADIRAFFDEVDHRLLMREVERLVEDDGIRRLIRLWLRAEIQQGKRRWRIKKGVPQGSPISPMLANLYLDRLDEAMMDEGRKLVRYADDFLVLCKTRNEAEDALELTETVLDALRLEINENKTRIVDFNQGFRFLGVQFIRSLAFKLEHAHEPPLPAVAADSRPRKKPPEAPPPVTTLAAAFAEAGIRPGDFPEAPEPSFNEIPAAPGPDHRLDPRLRTLYLLKHGQVLGKESQRLIIRHEGRIQQEIPVIKVDQIMIFGNAQVTTQAMHLCLAERIPIYLLSASGRFHGVIDSFSTEPVLLQQAQFRRADDPEFRHRIAAAMVRGKIANGRTLLKRLARKRHAPALEQAAVQLGRIAEKLPKATDIDQIRGHEGHAARTLFQAMSRIIDPKWQFNGRNKQPPRDPVNAMLSFGYTLLFYNIYSFIRARGLNPHIGFLHPARPGHPALASDLIEEFRALIVDPLVWNLVLNQRLDPGQFELPTAPGQGCRMNESARRRFIRDMEKKLNTPIKHPRTGERLDYRRCIEHQVDHLAAVIRGTEPRYIPMTSR